MPISLKSEVESQSVVLLWWFVFLLPSKWKGWNFSLKLKKKKMVLQNRNIKWDLEVPVGAYRAGTMGKKAGFLQETWDILWTALKFGS